MILYRLKEREQTHKIIENILRNPDCDYYLFPRQYGVSTAIVNLVNEGNGKYGYLGNQRLISGLSHKLFYSSFGPLIRDHMVGGESFDILFVDNRYWIWDNPLSEFEINKLGIAASRVVFVATIEFEGISNIQIPKNKKLQIIQFSADDDQRYAELLSQWEKEQGEQN
jgi:hypothetical protein